MDKKKRAALLFLMIALAFVPVFREQSKVAYIVTVIICAACVTFTSIYIFLKLTESLNESFGDDHLMSYAVLFLIAAAYYWTFKLNFIGKLIG